ALPISTIAYKTMIYLTDRAGLSHHGASHNARRSMPGCATLPMTASLPSTLLFPHSGAPAPGRVTEVAPGVRWLRMPLPFALDHINLWLLEDEIGGSRGWTAIDTGFGDAPTRE